MIRVVLAALFVFACPLIVVGLMDGRLPDPWPWWAMAAPAVAMFAAMAAAMFAFNGAGRRPVPGRQTQAGYVAGLEARGLLSRQSCRALRAFAAAEYEDEGPHYFIELEDRRVLCLTGQYLYDYEPLEADDDEPARARSFPCTAFEVVRHRQSGHVVDIDGLGQVLEPEMTVPYLGDSDDYADGAVLAEGSYEPLREMLAKRVGRRAR